MELRHLRYFVAVAEELHFGRAADRLHISQPPLSHQIQNLERELGVELLHRTKRTVRLTAVGQLFLEEARHVLREAEHAVEVAQKASRGEIGRLSVGFGPTPESGFLRKVLALFLARHPDVRLDLRSLYTQEQVEALANRRIQVALPLLPIPSRGLVVERIGTEPVVVALPYGHPLAMRHRVAVSSLQNESFILISRAIGGFYDLVVGACRQAGFTPRITHEASHVYTVLGFVAAGLGVTLVPNSVATNPRDGVVYRPLRDPALSVELGLAYRRDDPSATLSAFLDVVREVAHAEQRGYPAASAGAKLGPVPISAGRWRRIAPAP